MCILLLLLRVDALIQSLEYMSTLIILWNEVQHSPSCTMSIPPMNYHRWLLNTQDSRLWFLHPTTTTIREGITHSKQHCDQSGSISSTFDG